MHNRPLGEALAHFAHGGDVRQDEPMPGSLSCCPITASITSLLIGLPSPAAHCSGRRRRPVSAFAAPVRNQWSMSQVSELLSPHLAPQPRQLRSAAPALASVKLANLPCRGMRVRDLASLEQAIEANTSPFHALRTEAGKKIALDRTKVEQSEERTMRNYRIPSSERRLVQPARLLVAWALTCLDQVGSTSGQVRRIPDLHPWDSVSLGVETRHHR